MKVLLAGVATLLVAFSAAGSAACAEWKVKMLNRAPDGRMMAFEPAYMQISPGDKVTFVPTDKGHNAESILGMAPNDTAAFKGAIDQQIVVQFKKPGLYGYQCLPHVNIGMVGLIQVGLVAPNKAQATATAATKLRGMGRSRMKELLGQAR